MKIGYRTLKTAIATPIALIVANLLGITNVVSAAIFTILCIQPSRKQSVKTAVQRIISSIIVIILSITFFELFGYHYIVLSLLLILFIVISVMLKLEQAILTSIVILLNIFTFGVINLGFVKEQLFLTFIGVGIGLLVNLYMPDLNKPLKRLQIELEDYFQVVLHEIGLYLSEENLHWDGKELSEIDRILDEAKQLVERDQENYLFKEKISHEVYFSMRQKQFELLKQMLPVVTRIPKRDDISDRAAAFFESLSQAVHPGDTTTIYLNKLDEIRKAFDRSGLPETQEDFEARSAVFQLLYLIEEYLLLKHRYRQTGLKHDTKRKRQV